MIDLEYIIGIAIGSLAILFLIAFLLFLFIRNKQVSRQIKKHGNIFEEKLTKSFENIASQSKNKIMLLGPSLYKYHENVMFEVDNILVTDKVIIVVEAKSLNGEIKANGDSTKWTQIKKGSNKTFYNPVLQNKKHINHVEKILGKPFPYVSLIIFDDIATEIKPDNIPDHVVISKYKYLDKVINSILNSTTTSIKNEDIDEIYQTLLSKQTKKRSDINFFYRQVKKIASLN